jgi:hypothetical protein
VKGDIAALEKVTSDDYTLINMNGKMSDKSQMVGGIRSGQTKLTSDATSQPVRLTSQTAQLLCTRSQCGVSVGPHNVDLPLGASVRPQFKGECNSSQLDSGPGFSLEFSLLA